MAKNILQDIVPPEKRSIRNIPLPVRKEKTSPVDVVRRAPVYKQEPEPEPESDTETPRMYSYEDESKPPRRFQGKSIWVATGVALVIVILAYLSLSSGAKVEITPRLIEASASSTIFSAYNSSTNGSGAPYQIVTITKDMGASVPATGSEVVNTKATGQITIYNNVSKASQALVANTRFQTPEGLIYRIGKAVTVPGQTVSVGQTIPGSLTVTVTADEAGSNYNIGLEDFTVPGFASDPLRSKNFYARSKTPMTGGATGTVKKVSDADMTTGVSGLESSLNTELGKEIGAQIPAGYTYFADGLFTTYAPLPQTNATDNSVTINERGTMTALIFNNQAFASSLASSLLPDNASSSLAIANLSSLPFTIQNKANFDPNKDTVLTFTVPGTIQFVGSFNVPALQAELAGKPKTTIQSILDQDPNILKIDAMLKPFWKHSFPTEAKSITIVTLPAQAQ